MNYKYIAIALGAVMLFTFGYAYFSQDSGVGGGTVQNQPRYNSASTTLYSIGPDQSTQIMAARGNRAAFVVCNDHPLQPAYIAFTDTAFTATTSAHLPVNADECLEFSNKNFIWFGAVHAIGEDATTTSLFVVEVAD